MGQEAWSEGGGLYKVLPQSLEAARAEEAEVTPMESGAESVAFLARRLEAALQAAMSELVKYATELALAATEALVRRSGMASAAGLEAALRGALELLAAEMAVEVRVHPTQAQLARQLCAGLQRWPRVVICEDEAISPGGCLVRTDLGEVDATLESRLRRLREELRA
jgi:flagellar assembly protein FliH